MIDNQTYDTFNSALKRHLVHVMGQPEALAPYCRHAIRLVQQNTPEKEPQFAGSGLLEFGRPVTAGQLVAELELEGFLSPEVHLPED